MIETRNISFKIGDKTLLNDIDLEIHPGEVLAIIGPNGAGKSTLLKVLTGEVASSGGIVYVEDKDVRIIKRDELARVRAVVNQHAEVTFPFTLHDIISMGRYPHNSSEEQDEAIVAQAMDVTEVGPLAGRIYNTLSGGEQQRGQMARALAQILPMDQTQQRYILLDEPISNMDLSHQHASMGYLSKLARQGIGVVIILHDINLASIYADKIAVIHDSRLVTLGSPSEVVTNEVLETIFQLPADVTRHPQLGCPMIMPLLSTP